MEEDDYGGPYWGLPGLREAMCDAVGLDPLATIDDTALEGALWELGGLLMRGTFGQDPRLVASNIAEALASLRRFRKSLQPRRGGLGLPHDARERMPPFLAALGQLEGLLVAAQKEEHSEAAWRPLGDHGRGRPPKARTAYLAAEIAARFFYERTGSIPTYSTVGTTPYKRLLERVFQAVCIRADTRRPAEWAIRQITLK